MTGRLALAEMLIAHGLVDHDALDLAIDRADAEERSLLAVLKERNAVDDVLIAKMLSSELNLYRIDLDQRVIDKSVLVELEPRLAHHLRVVPVGLKRTNEIDLLYVAVSDPTGPALAEIQAQTQKQVVPLVATEGALERVLNRSYPGNFEPIRASPNPVDMPAFADVVVGNIIDTPPPADRGGSEWLTASTQEVLEIYAPTLHLPEAKSPSSQARDDDWLRQRLELAQGPQETPAPTLLPSGAISAIGSSSHVDDDKAARATLDLGSAPASTTAAERLTAARELAQAQAKVEAERAHVQAAQQAKSAAREGAKKTPTDRGATDETSVVQGQAVSLSQPTLDDDNAPLSPSIGEYNENYRVGIAPIDAATIAPAPVRKPTLPSAALPELRPMTIQSLAPVSSHSDMDSAPTHADEGDGDGDSDGDSDGDGDGDNENPGGVTFVCEDQNIRLQLRTALADVLDELYDHNNLSDAKSIVENGTIRRVVLLYPRADGALVSILRNLRSMVHPPSVLVISRNRAFEVMRGVDVRIDPPDELSLLPEAIFDALARLGTR